MIHIQNCKQAPLCLLFVYLQSGFPYFNGKYRLLPPAGMDIISSHAAAETPC